jgi:hypothetical protein
MIHPVIEIAQNDAGWNEILPEILVLGGLILLSILLVGFLARRSRFQAA